MLRQARPNAPDIAWVQADGSALPFQTGSFDFITCQFALHHIQDKVGMLRETFHGRRTFDPSQSLSPRMRRLAILRLFPEAKRIDLEDFWPPETVMAEMHSSGFVAVTEEREHLHFEQHLRSWLDRVRRRDTCSQLLAITDVGYQAGLSRLMHDAGRSHLSAAAPGSSLLGNDSRREAADRRLEADRK